jgi:GNAT superfamily N-acetyltransferase
MEIKNQTEILIREASETDASQISDLITRTVLEFQDEDLTKQGKKSLLETMTPEAISGYIFGDTYRYYVADHQGKVVGVIATKENRHLFQLFVAKEFHKRGIATKLWKSALDHSISIGNKGYFTVFSSGYALEFYTKMGFVPTGDAFWKNGVRSTPMEWKK